MPYARLSCPTQGVLGFDRERHAPSEAHEVVFNRRDGEAAVMLPWGGLTEMGTKHRRAPWRGPAPSLG